MRESSIVGLVAVVIGIVALLFRRSFAREVIRFQNSVWGFSFGEREVKISGVVISIVGVASVVFGLLAMFRVIEFRK